MRSQVGVVASDDELAQTREAGAEVEPLGATMDNADRILAAARELDKQLIADAFSDAKRLVHVQSGADVLNDFFPSPAAALPEGQEYSRLQLALEQAQVEAQESQKAKTQAERELAAARASLRNERDRVRVMEAELQEERAKLEVESRRREALLRRIDELEELVNQNAASSLNRDPAGPGGTHGDEASGSASREAGSASADDRSEEFSKLESLFERLDQTLAELDDRNLSCLSLASKKFT